ncbi:MAG TPA: SAM-dependent methyltransferase [Streptosporangiaceae bacterium]|nr:SAM-dependent methyltransferase [Streptosporangiaceae bacterium]
MCNPTCNDQIVLAHARALLTSTPEGATAYVQP